jgi:hypothetical protein
MADFAEVVRPVLEPQLEPGETILGIAAATHRKTFSGGLVGIGVTDRRLLLQPLDRRFQQKGPSISITPASLASVRLGGSRPGGGGVIETSDIVDAVSETVQLETTGGQKLKLMMMTGDGMLGRLGGGESQREGVRAFLERLDHHPPHRLRRPPIRPAIRVSLHGRRRRASISQPPSPGRP